MHMAYHWLTMLSRAWLHWLATPRSIWVQPKTLYEEMRRHDITLTGHTSENHHSLGQFSLHDTRSVLWTVCKLSIILYVVLLILTKVFLVGKEADCLWFSSMFHIAQRFHPLCKAILTGLFCEQLTSTTLVWVATKVFIECQLHGRDWNIQHTRQSPNSDAWVFQDIYLHIFKEFCRTNAIRSSVVLLSSIHILVVYVTLLLFMPDCPHSVQGALSSNRNLLILMTGVDYHDTWYSLPWFSGGLQSSILSVIT